jgi:hypothetical protein
VGVYLFVFDANVIFGEKHLISAVEHAVRAIDRKTNTTNSLEMEILLYASVPAQEINSPSFTDNYVWYGFANEFCGLYRNN